jgi:predicted PurR-regulated permease PerM
MQASETTAVVSIQAPGGLRSGHQEIENVDWGDRSLPARKTSKRRLDQEVARLLDASLVMSKVVFVTPEPLDSEVPQPEYSWAATIVTPLVIVAALWWGQSVVIPIVVSLLISYALEPTVARLERARVPRVVAAPLVLLTLLLAIGAGIYGLRGQAEEFAYRLPEGAHAIAQTVRSKTAGSSGPWARMQQAAKELETAAAAHPAAKSADGVQAVRIEEPTFRWTEWMWQGSHGVFELVTQLIVVMCLSYYLILSGDAYKRKLVRIVGPSISDKKVTVQILSEIDRQIGRFIWVRAAISAIVGAAVWLAFVLLGLEEAAVYGVISGILFTVPLVGPALVIGGAGIVGVMQTGSIATAASAAGICLAIAAIEGNLLGPWLLGKVGRMSAVAVFVSLLFWGWLWGAWGLLLAVPITAAIKAVCERVDDWNGFAELLSD